MKILLVEDDVHTAATIAQSLTAQNYLVNTAEDGQIGWEFVQAYDYDLILLDVQLPRLDGISLCRKLRAEGYQMPVLLLTARDDTHDRVVGLEAGADDYVIKPFDLSELSARIRALLRRGGAFVPTVLTWEKLQFDPTSSEVTYGEVPLRLTPKEYGLLELFLRNPRRIFSRSALLERLWASDEFPGEEAVTTHIKDLRRKLKGAGMTIDPIETIYGLGYRLKTAPEKVEEPIQPEQQSRAKAQAAVTATVPQAAAMTTQEAKAAAQAKVMAVVAAVLADFKASFAERLAPFEMAIAQLSSGTLEPAVQQQARAEAHKLIGSLGSFGLLESSQVARQIEQLLQSDQPLQPCAASDLAELVAQLKQTVDAPAATVTLNPAIENQISQKPPTPPQRENGRDLDRIAESVPAVAPRDTVFRLLVIDDDTVLARQLQIKAASWGLQVEVAANLVTARVQIASHPPDVVLLDLTFSDSTETGLTLLEELAAQRPEMPVLVFTAHNQLSDRVEVARLGGRGFLNKPIAPEQVFKAVLQVLDQPQAVDAHILIVDDDTLLLSSLRALLQPWGFQITTLENPGQFWETLETTAPDLLILDVQMPEFNGIELCQVVRNDPRWSQMPILFLSAHRDAETLHQVFTAGADDYVAKPVVGPELLARILNRLERVQMLRKLAETCK